jgi:hypothetical protein
VALADNTLLVGAPANRATPLATTTTFTAKLTHTDGSVANGFGFAVVFTGHLSLKLNPVAVSGLGKLCRLGTI